MMNRRSVLPVLAITLAVFGVSTAGRVLPAGEETQAPPGVREALAEFNSLIGEWRGVGQPRRGSRAGAWREQAEWVWNFKDGVAIEYRIDGGRQLQKGVLTYDPRAKQYHLQGSFADDVRRDYAGTLVDGKLVLDSQPDDEGYVHRITVHRLNEKRTLVHYERKYETQNVFGRVAEVGYTREGTRLTTIESSDPECIVTGGGATMRVSYKGETYYVCCSGCRDAFNDEPEKYIAEAKQRAGR